MNYNDLALSPKQRLLYMAGFEIWSFPAGFIFVPLKKTEVIGRDVWNFLMSMLLVRDNVFKTLYFIFIMPGNDYQVFKSNNNNSCRLYIA